MMKTDCNSAVEMPCSIEPYVPQAGHMCLLDTLLSANADSLEALVVATPSSEFATDRGIPGWVGLEWMAQAIAAWSGVQARAAGDAPAIGFLLGTREYQCRLPWFALGDSFRVRVTLDFQAENGLGSFVCHIFDSNDEEIASAQVNVFQPGPEQDLKDLQGRGFK